MMRSTGRERTTSPWKAATALVASTRNSCARGQGYDVRRVAVEGHDGGRQWIGAQVVFKHHRERAAQEREEEAKATRDQQWQGYAELVELAETFHGTATDALVLNRGEAAYYVVTNAALVEERRGRGHYQGGSTGFSVPIGLGMRYRVGGFRGHYVQAPPTPTAIDTGTMVITNKRVVFVGQRQTRECRFEHLLAVHHDDEEGETTISVSNRQRPTILYYGSALSAQVDFRLSLALADFAGTRDQLVTQLRQELAAADSQAPQ
jgi:hypothetical protein